MPGLILGARPLLLIPNVDNYKSVRNIEFVGEKDKLPLPLIPFRKET